MTSLPPVLDELIHDPERKRAEAQLFPFIEGMKAEGLEVRAICRAMAHVLVETCLSEYELWGAHRLWATKFLRELSEDIAITVHSIDEVEGRAVDKLLEEEAEREREALQ